MSSSRATVRNVLIVLVIAALVVAIPGGGTGATVALQAASLAFLASLGWFASLMYRQHRIALYSLGDGRRAVLYAAAAVATLTLTGTSRLLATSASTIVWCVLLIGAAYSAFAVIWAARKY
jgi:DNA-binding FadR family transcriptional regulator